MTCSVCHTGRAITLEHTVVVGGDARGGGKRVVYRICVSCELKERKQQ